MKADYHLNIIHADDPAQLEIYEQLRTRSLADESTVEIIKEETTFTKEGFYIIAVHWIELGSSEEDHKVIKDMLSEKG